jgi:hypothetical protein
MKRQKVKKELQIVQKPTVDSAERRLWMKRTAIILLCLLLVAAFVAPAFGHDKGGKSPAYSVSNPNHTQALGGKSQNAGRGLQIAASRSAAVQGGTVVVPPPK